MVKSLARPMRLTSYLPIFQRLSMRCLPKPCPPLRPRHVFRSPEAPFRSFFEPDILSKRFDRIVINGVINYNR